MGRLKAYKNVEVLLDVIETLPGVYLDVVGEGDHRPDLEEEIRRRGLEDRVVMHGYVDHERKVELYGRAWVNMTASQSEGWSLAVIEAAMCATPTVALAVGGLTESVVDGETGLLARDLAGLTDHGPPPDRGRRAARAHGRRGRASGPHLQLGPSRPEEPRDHAPGRPARAPPALIATAPGLRRAGAVARASGCSRYQLTVSSRSRCGLRRLRGRLCAQCGPVDVGGDPRLQRGDDGRRDGFGRRATGLKNAASPTRSSWWTTRAAIARSRCSGR